MTHRPRETEKSKREFIYPMSLMSSVCDMDENLKPPRQREQRKGTLSAGLEDTKLSLPVP